MTRLVSLQLLFSILVSASISAEEPNLRLQRFFEKFPEADLNKDGKVTFDEASKFKEKMRGSQSQRSNEPQAPGNRYTTEEMAKIFEAREFKSLPYRFFEPAAAEGEKYPLILSLHGAGGKGDDNLKNLKFWNGITTESEFQKKYPSFVVVPQSPGPWRVPGSEPELTEELIATFSDVWQEVVKKRRGFVEKSENGKLGLVFELLDSLAEEYPIDTDRIYVLGHSMGGFGSFEALAMQPNRFAAAIPSAGGLSPWHDPTKFKDVPVWAFHGDQDTTVIPELAADIFEQLKAADGNMKFTLLGGVGHGAGAFVFVYEGDKMNENFKTMISGEKCDLTENVWDWLFAQKR